MPPLHPWWMVIVLFIFTLMCLYGLVQNIRARRKFPSVLLFLAFFVFGYTTFFIVAPW